MIQTGAPEVGEIPKGEEKSQSGEGRKEKKKYTTFIATHGLNAVRDNDGGSRRPP